MKRRTRNYRLTEAGGGDATSGLPSPDTSRPPQPPAPYKKGFCEAKLNPDQQREVCALIARFHTAKDIVEHCQKDWGITMTPRAITNYGLSGKWRPLIERFRTEYLAEISQVPIFHTRVRMERLEKLFQQVSSIQTTSYMKQRLIRAEAMQMLDLARKEVEATKKAGDTNILAITYNQMTDTELIQRRNMLLTKLKILTLPKGDPDAENQTIDAVAAEQRD